MNETNYKIQKMLRFALFAVLIPTTGAFCSQPYPDAPTPVLMLSFLAAAPQIAAAAGGDGTSPVPPKKLFVTAATFNGNLGGITGADTACANDTAKPDGNVYRAMIVDGANRNACTNANCSPADPNDGLDWVFAASTTYYRFAGSALQPVVTTDANRILDFGGGNLAGNGFSDSAADEWWTGMGPGWNVFNDCSDWTDGLIGNGETGAGVQPDADAIALGTPGCILPYRLVCVEQ